ncbi:hypothetical protein RGUI_0808 [Rhodovulum sp. P5]|uniref:hypothetical protein n=1 Tax=Rhodovulum phage vB_RhkS_P1 TaxID=1873452 RepID=UPI00080AA23E|nr:hypothetical protein [Rhodovulum sp. P5]YP_009285893.1 hypothetical protein BI026_gp08 [Rhodovulum phage vB_RhkS_P1]ANT39879.1 hypothetical protein Rhks_8 [Rhodovulum phage vB_RhkS_P1]ARE38251.1 hypothetical protein RGUI_0110 [Rhodovulum sp. P5]ARE38949.1 hypothetical protein RGUI_0808 [Rhodovulum sp. P5]
MADTPGVPELAKIVREKAEEAHVRACVLAGSASAPGQDGVLPFNLALVASSAKALSYWLEELKTALAAQDGGAK